MIKKYVKPFSNGTQAMIWESNNCDQCKRSGCYQKIAIQNAYITGHITWNVANFIGFKRYVESNFGNYIMAEDDYCELNEKCNHFNKPIIKPKKGNANELKLF